MVIDLKYAGTTLSSILVALVITLLAASCSESTDMDIDFSKLVPSEMTISVYESGRLIHSGIWADESEELQQLSEWLRMNRGDWQIDLVTYAPSLEIRSPALVVNVLSDGVIINYETDQGWKQVSRDASPALRKELVSKIEME